MINHESGERHESELISKLNEWRVKHELDVPERKEKPVGDVFLRTLAMPAVQVTQEECHYEKNQAQAEYQAGFNRYDDEMEKAISDREEEITHSMGNVDEHEHPTARIFRLGVESIRQGRPSETFLGLLELIGSAAGERDVLQLVFNGVIKKPVLKRSLRAAAMNDRIIQDFIDHVGEYLSHTKLPRHYGITRFNFAEAKESFKRQSTHHAKAIDRALSKRNLDYTKSKT